MLGGKSVSCQVECVCVNVTFKSYVCKYWRVSRGRIERRLIRPVTAFNLFRENIIFLSGGVIHSKFVDCFFKCFTYDTRLTPVKCLTALEVYFGSLTWGLTKLAKVWIPDSYREDMTQGGKYSCGTKPLLRSVCLGMPDVEMYWCSLRVCIKGLSWYLQGIFLWFGQRCPYLGCFYTDCSFK